MVAKHAMDPKRVTRSPNYLPDFTRRNRLRYARSKSYAAVIRHRPVVPSRRSPDISGQKRINKNPSSKMRGFVIS